MPALWAHHHRTPRHRRATAEELTRFFQRITLDLEGYRRFSPAALGLGSTGLLLAMGLVFFVGGAANDGSGMAGSIYLLEIVPEDERPTNIGLANTTLGIVTFLPVLGGWLVGRIGYNGTFVSSLVFALIGLLASAQLGEPSARRPG